MERKGFPESYDRKALLRFVTAVKSGAAEVRAPFYSHLSYDIVPDAEIVVRRPDVLIVEGLNVLQPAGGGNRLAVSDLFDFSVYVDARTRDIARWYEERFLKLQRGAFANPKSYFHRYADLTEERGAASAPRPSGPASTSRTSCRTSARRARARSSSCARTTITPSARCSCASCRVFRPGAQMRRAVKLWPWMRVVA